MELDNIQLQTTWNDAVGSLNNNFSKIRQAIALASLGNAVMLDTEMSDESENAVQNKAIKAYVDERIEDITHNIETIQSTLLTISSVINDMQQATISPLYEG